MSVDIIAPSSGVAREGVIWSALGNASFYFFGRGRSGGGGSIILFPSLLVGNLFYFGRRGTIQTDSARGSKRSSIATDIGQLKSIVINE